ncbi:MAG TPA: GGDEF domain-containing protein [Thermoanaerobaculia bacterium]|nr:GGDEF domain-containing protein [Thermoanaerobaculia bacterium]
MDDGKRSSQEFADIVPGRTTEVYLDVTERRTEAERADERQPALVMLQGDLPGQVFRLPIGRQLIGRKGDCQIRLREKAVSAHHAEIVHTDAGVSVSDLESTNGTVVNGRRIRTPVFLAQGNLVKLGNSVFKYVDSLVEVELTEALHARSTIDSMTGLWNRQHLVARLGYMIDGATSAKPVSVIAFEMHRLTDRRAGLLAVTRLLRNTFDDLGRYFGRIGDESFAIILSGTPRATATAVAAELRKSLESAGLHAAIGVSGTERHTEGAETLLTAAEEAMSKAAREGGNRVVLG